MEMDSYFLVDFNKKLERVVVAIDAAGENNAAVLNNIRTTLKAIDTSVQDLVAAMQDVSEAIRGDAARFKAANDPPLPTADEVKGILR